MILKKRVSSIVLMLCMTIVMFCLTNYITQGKLPDTRNNVIAKQLIRNGSNISEEDFLNLTSFDINTVTQEELMSIPNIGKVYSSRIIDYRYEHGKVESIDELLTIKGIGEQRLALLKQYLYVK